MKEWQILTPVRWKCKYHIVLMPKYRKKVMYGRKRRTIGKTLCQLCQQKGVELLAGHAMPNHIHQVLSIPPKFSVAIGGRVSEREIGNPNSSPDAEGKERLYREALLV